MFGVLSNNGATDHDCPRATLESDYDTDNLCGASLESRGLWTLLYVFDDTGIALCELFCVGCSIYRISVKNRTYLGIGGMINKQTL